MLDAVSFGKRALEKASAKRLKLEKILRHFLNQFQNFIHFKGTTRSAQVRTNVKINNCNTVYIRAMTVGTKISA